MRALATIEGGQRKYIKRMQMKDFVIGVNNIVLYVALAVILIVSLFMMSQSFLSGLGMFVGGTLGWCIVSGFWFVQSATYEELRKLNSKTS